MNELARLLKLSKNFQMLFEKYRESIWKSVETWNKKLRIEGVPVCVSTIEVIDAFYILGLNNRNLNYLLDKWDINRLAQNIRRYYKKAINSVPGYKWALSHSISVLIALRIIKLEYKARSLDHSVTVDRLEF